MKDLIFDLSQIFVYLVMKDELGIWNKGAEEEKIKPVESY